MQKPFDLYSPEIDSDPFPMYEWLRENQPVYWNERDQYWVLSRYDDVFRAAQDWETFSSTGGNLIDEIPGRTGATLGTTDPPRHDRLRALRRHLRQPSRDSKPDRRDRHERAAEKNAGEDDSNRFLRCDAERDARRLGKAGVQQMTQNLRGNSVKDYFGSTSQRMRDRMRREDQ